MSIPVPGGAPVTAAALLEAAALIEQAGTAGLFISCYEDRVSLYAGPRTGDVRQRAAVVAALGELAGAARCAQRDGTGQNPAAWLEATGQADGTVIEIATPLAVRAVPGGTLAAGPRGQQAVIAAGQQLPPGWRWVTDLDGQPGGGQPEVA
jgi:hypothetical protein